MTKLIFVLGRLGTRTPLHAAAYKGHLDVIRALVEAGAITILRNPDYGTPPIIHAMHNLQNEAAEYLRHHPMAIFATIALCPPVPIKAVLKEDPELANVQFRSVRNGSQETNERDWATPLWFAVMDFRNNVVLVLLDHSANPNVTDPSGKSLFDYALDKNQPQISEILSQLTRLDNSSAVFPETQ